MTFFITPFHYTDCFSVRQIGYGGTPCPKGIDVASVTKFLNLARAQGMVPETVREHYAALARKAGECIACGACSKRCPFGVDAVENMRRAEETFGA